MKKILGLVLLCAVSLAAKNLEVYVIDVEGGKSVLLVSPAGESMLFDAGWPKFNNIQPSTDRIVEVANAAGLKKVDHLVISHFDIDHIGDVPALAARIPIGHLYDHGEIAVTAAGAERAKQRFAPYAAFREKVAHTTLKPGDKVPLKGVDVLVVAAGGKKITKALSGAGASNPLCATYKQADARETDIEDDQSVGLLITLGKFRMLDLGDLEAHDSRDLVCPVNLIGNVDVYNLNVHGQFKGLAPEMAGALRAPVIIQANGARKGADAQTWPVLRATPGLKDIWQLHYSVPAGKDANPPDDFVVNPDGPDSFKWLLVSASRDGAFTVTNTRNGFSQKYRR